MTILMVKMIPRNIESEVQRNIKIRQISLQGLRLCLEALNFIISSRKVDVQPI